MKVKKIPVNQRQVNVSLGNTRGVTKGTRCQCLWALGNHKVTVLGTGSVSSQGSVDLDDIIPLINRPDSIVLHVGG